MCFLQGNIISTISVNAHIDMKENWIWVKYTWETSLVDFFNKLLMVDFVFNLKCYLMYPLT